MPKGEITVVCYCSKESEIAEMYTDIKWIRKALEGNGTKGLIQRVTDNEKKIWMAAGGLAVISILATILGLFGIIA